jgi:DNA-binding CsgD family transcriptional regulator
VRQLLEREVWALPSSERKRVFAGAAGPAAGVLGLPARDRVPVSETDPAFLVRHALVWVLEALAEPGPVAVVVDDLQWADAASLRWLADLARRIEEMPVLVLGALRTGEPPTAPEAVAEVEAAAGADLLRPAALSVEAVAALTMVELGAGDPEFALRCHQATAGNPLLVRELLRAVSEEGLAPVRASAAKLEELAGQRLGERVLRRVARLSASARELASAVAVLEAAELWVAAGLAGLSSGEAVFAADELYEAGILAAERPLRFVHPLLRSAVEADLPPARRASAHRRAAVLLDADPARADEAVVHLLRAEPAGDPWVVDRMCAGGSRALERGAADAAVTLLERALSEPAGEARGAVLAELGRAQRWAGRFAEAAEHLMQAQSLVDARDREPVAHELAWALLAQNRPDEGAGVLEAAIADFEGADEDVREARLRLEADYAMVGFYSTLTSRTLERTRRAAAGLAGSTQPERAVLMCGALARYWSGSVNAEAFMVEVERLIELGTLRDDVIAGSIARILLVIAVFNADAVELAIALIDELITRERRRGDVWLLGAYLNTLARILVYLGRLSEAEVAAREGLELPIADGYARPALVAALVSSLVAAGRLEEAEAAVALVDPEEPIGPVGTFHAARMELRSAQGRHEEALADAKTLLARLDLRRHAGLRLLDAAAAAFLAAGDPVRAAEVARRGLKVSRAWGAPSTIASNLRVLGQATGDEDALREAVALLDGSPLVLERARAVLALGAHLRRTRRRSEARDPLRTALDLSYRCGAQPLTAEASVELRACGARPRSIVLSGVESLTASERRVAEMVAAGRSNPQVAQALFLSRATVESHLRSIFRKLDVSSRDQLGPLLGRKSSLTLNDASGGSDAGRSGA